MAFNISGHITTGSLMVEETSADVLVKIPHCKPPALGKYATNFLTCRDQDSNHELLPPQRLEASALTTRPPRPLGFYLETLKSYRSRLNKFFRYFLVMNIMQVIPHFYPIVGQVIVKIFGRKLFHIDMMNHVFLA